MSPSKQSVRRLRTAAQPTRTTDLSTSVSSRRRWPRHVFVACAALVIGSLFWWARPDWDAEMRLWKAVGDTAYVLLLATMAVGPLARLARPARSWLRWRRQLGIWFALTATLHAVLVLNGWARWGLRRFLGYEFVPQLGREVRLEPGFGLANLVGAAALVLGLILAATSSDRALRALGRPAWTWLHRLAQTVLILSVLHGAYFLFIHYTESFHKVPPPLDWFRMPFLLAGLAVIALEVVAFGQAASRPPVDSPIREGRPGSR